MYRIGLCDDEPREMGKTELLLQRYGLAHPTRGFVVEGFSSMEALLLESRQAGRFDLLILDIYLPDKTGIVGAKELRAQGVDCPIIFLTNSVDHAIEAFDVDAVRYLIKPVEQGRFFAAMDKAICMMEKERDNYIAVRADGEMRRILLTNIVCCESHGNYQHVSLVEGASVRVRITLAELHSLMGQPYAFVRVGSAYLVNLSHVDRLSAKEILLDNGQKIGVPRGAYPGLKEQYFKFYCNEEDDK